MSDSLAASVAASRAELQRIEEENEARRQRIAKLQAQPERHINDLLDDIRAGLGEIPPYEPKVEPQPKQEELKPRLPEPVEEVKPQGKQVGVGQTGIVQFADSKFAVRVLTAPDKDGLMKITPLSGIAVGQVFVVGVGDFI
jgi:hypothetical protein